jgi:hypothetical protein
LLQAVTWCAGEIAGTLVRFTAYCAVIAAAVLGVWVMLQSLYVEDPPRAAAPSAGQAAPVPWLDGAALPPLRRTQRD